MMPRYLTLEPTSWFDDCYQDVATIELELVAIDEDQISFTYLDSMLLAEDG